MFRKPRSAPGLPALLALALVLSGAMAQAQTARSSIELDATTPRALIVQQLQAGTVAQAPVTQTAQPAQAAAAVAAVPGTPQEATLLMPVQFGFDSTALNAQARGILDVVAAAMRDPALAGSRFLLEGHTDATGSWAYNKGLSERRAQAVATYLISQGVTPERLLVVGYSWNRLLPGLAVNDPRHRRVEIGRLAQ
ncbi:MAG: OmpA family protein [Rhodobacteraceae bacterium]|nr:OmpA family protein [Paracoccaceae bacterium]